MARAAPLRLRENGAVNLAAGAAGALI